MLGQENFQDIPSLNIAAIVPHTQALGPGTRAAIWVQGCPFRCPGCVAPDWIPFVAATRLTPEEILERIDLNKITGITFSGGEPMAQAAELAALIRLARQKKDLDLICFTGYRYERLLKHPPNQGVPQLIAEVDVLIDGPYIQALNDSIGLRGSSNQRVIYLTSKLKDHILESGTRHLEVTVTDGELAFVGIPTPGMTAAIGSTTYTYKERMK